MMAVPTRTLARLVTLVVLSVAMVYAAASLSARLSASDISQTNTVAVASSEESTKWLTADEPRAPPSPDALQALHGNGTGPVPLPATDGVPYRVGVVTVGVGRYRQFGLELLYSAAEYLCRCNATDGECAGADTSSGRDTATSTSPQSERCKLTLMLLTSRVNDLTPEQLRPTNWPARQDGIIAKVVPFRKWPMSTLNKCNDILAFLRKEIDALDFVLFLDADTRFVTPVALSDIYGILVGVEHPYYPRYARGFCGRYGDAPSTNGHGFDKNGQWTFCQYPYDRNQRSTAYIDTALGKSPPLFDHGNSFYFQGALFGGIGRYFLYACESIDRATKQDLKNDITASFHDESQLNAFLLRHMDITRVLDPSFIYPEPPLDKQFNFEWLFERDLKAHIVHRVKDADSMRHDL